MKKVFFTYNDEKYYIIAGKTAKKQKDLLRCGWKTLLSVLCRESFPNIEKVTEKTNNNHIITVPNFEELVFFVINLKIDSKKVFVVTSNEKVLSIKMKKFGKWIAKLECGHVFLMDSSVDDYRFVKRVFCPTCMEQTDDSIFEQP